MHNSYNQFYSTVFCLLYMFRTNLVVHHQEHDVTYCVTQFGTIGTIVQASLVASKQLDSILYRALDDERLDSLETCRADKICGLKIDYKNCASRWSYDARYTQFHVK